MNQEQKQNCDSQHKPEPSNTRKCFNKLCTSKKIYKKIRSRVQFGKYRFLCKNCHDNYSKDNYCQFCQQIYSNNQNEQEDNKWIGCDRCDKWNHIECEKKYRDKNIQDNKDKNVVYECLACSRKSRNNQQPPQQHKQKYKTEREYFQNRRQRKIEIKQNERFLIFHKKIQNLQSLQSLLQNFNFRICLNDNIIREDIDNLRVKYEQNNESDGKSKKKIKIQ